MASPQNLDGPGRPFPKRHPLRMIGASSGAGVEQAVTVPAMVRTSKALAMILVMASTSLSSVEKPIRRSENRRRPGIDGFW